MINLASASESTTRNDTQIRSELEQSGLKILKLPKAIEGEVPTHLIGYTEGRSGWSFHRAWRYYIAKGPGIPPDIAQAFHEEWGQQVRVDGHCGCPSPLDWFEGFAVGHYHIDTQEGLNAFVRLLQSIKK